jgi:hypothetical protein
MPSKKKDKIKNPSAKTPNLKVSIFKKYQNKTDEPLEVALFFAVIITFLLVF